MLVVCLSYHQDIGEKKTKPKITHKSTPPNTDTIRKKGSSWCRAQENIEGELI